MIIKRYKDNPILTPIRSRTWEAEAVFNGCPIEKDEKTFFLYRAVSLPRYNSMVGSRISTSNIGVATSDDGLNFSDRKRFIVPYHDWEKFGCEDPRVTELDGKYYIFYTAISAWPPNSEGIKVGVAISNDLQTVEQKHLVTPFNAKAMSLFPERINGKIWAILTVNTDKPPARICLASFDNIEEVWSEDYWNEWYRNFEDHSIPIQRSPDDHIEVGATPIKTERGWLFFYSYIRNYYSNNKFFGLETALLDLNDPSKIVARNDFPILYPEEYYERHGMAPNIIFPSGALLKEDTLSLYYGAADTTCAVAFIDLPFFLDRMTRKQDIIAKFSRAKENPIIVANKDNSWESRATFNPAALYLDGKVHILYRAMSEDNTSTVGYAQSSDGVTIDYRASEPVYVPKEDFEQKTSPNGFSGCEDPRLVQIDSTIYMFYTAYNGKNPPRVAITSISVDDFLAQKWNWTTAKLISVPDLDNKDAAMFPEKIDGKYVIIHRSGDDMDLSYHDNLDFEKGEWLQESRWIHPRPGWWDSKKVGLSTPPIKTKEGWLIFYHGVSDQSVYTVGAVLADLKDPSIILGRTDYPFFEPETSYEKSGQVPNVVFPCGTVLIDGNIFVYYGGADEVVGVATISLEKVLSVLRECKV